MSEAGWRLILVGSVALCAVLVAALGFLQRRLAVRAAASGRLDLTGVDGAVLLFTTAPCPSCDAARSRLERIGVSFREVGYHDLPDIHRAVGIAAVPLIVVRGPEGEIVGRIAGKPPIRRLRRLFRAAPGK